jgi:predicted RNA-binding Zn-ribbon protein involved in translation (DUF1610 family)
VIRYRPHPDNTDVLVLDVDNDHWRDLGRFTPARREDTLGRNAYLLDANKLDSLQIWCASNDIPLLNATTTDPGEKRLPLECAACGQPVRNRRGDTPPKYCPACGDAFVGAHPPAHTTASITRYPCLSCGHTQTSRLPICTQCGGIMNIPNRNPHPNPATRPHLDNPMSLADTITELVNPDDDGDQP